MASSALAQLQSIPLNGWTISAAIVGILLAALGAVLLYLTVLNASSNGPDAPPVWGGGLPIVGHFLRFSSGPVHVIREGYAKNGPVFTMKFLGKSLTFLIGPEAQAKFYDARDQDLSQNEPYKFMTPVFGPGIVFDAPISVKRQQLTFVSKALKGDVLKAYVPLIVKETQEYLATLPNEGEIDLLDAMSYLTILTASRCLLGREVREKLFGDVYHLLREIDEGINPIAMFFPYLPLPMFRRRDAARKRIGELFGGIIRARREAGTSENDMLSLFMEAEYDDGSRCTDEQITGLLLAALFAGQHTSSISSTWTVLNLLHAPPFYARAMAEQARLAGDGAPTATASITYDALMSMDMLHNAMKESLRLAPPLIMLMRAVHAPLAVGKHVVPVGHYVFASPAVSMNLPDGAPDAVFGNPAAFDPDRFAPPRSEDKARPFAYTAFGGGPHRCLGEQFGYLQVKTIVSMLLRQFEVMPLDPLPVPNYRMMVVGPTQPTRVRIRRRTAPLAEPFKVPVL